MMTMMWKNRSEFGYLITLEEDKEDAPDASGGACSAAFEHDAEAHTLAVHAEWLPHLLRMSTEAMLTARNGESAFDLLTCSSRALALLSGECITAWNCRRVVVSSGRVVIVPEHELALCTLALSRQPKCGPTWQYRQWLLSSVEGLLTQPEDFEREFKVVDGCVIRYPRNYAGWQHRLWLVNKAQSILSETMNRQVLQDELTRSTEHCRRHVSDASAFHHRRLVLDRLYPCHTCPPHIAGAEACFALSLARVYPAHECLWIHCTFALQMYSVVYGQVIELKKSQAEEDEAEDFLAALDSTLPLFEDIQKLFDAHKPSPRILMLVVELMTEDDTSADFIKQRRLAEHCLKHCHT